MSSQKDRAIVVSALKHAAPYIRLFKGKFFYAMIFNTLLQSAQQVISTVNHLCPGCNNLDLLIQHCRGEELHITLINESHAALSPETSKIEKV